MRKLLTMDRDVEWYRDTTRRAHQTSARIFAEVPWQESEQLAPRAMGAWEGKTWEQIRRADAVRAEAFWNRFEDSSAPGESETLGAVLERTEAFLTGMGHRTSWECAVVVAAPEVIAVAVCSVLGIDLRSTLKFGIDPLTVTSMQHSWIGWQLGCLNCKP
jgi:broad specificity phosphatase PhoE